MGKPSQDSPAVVPQLSSPSIATAPVLSAEGASQAAAMQDGFALNIYRIAPKIDPICVLLGGQSN